MNQTKSFCPNVPAREEESVITSTKIEFYQTRHPPVRVYDA